MIIIGRVLTIFTTSVYWLFAIVSIIAMLTSSSIFMSPLVIAMETSKAEDRAYIAMLQFCGWTTGMCLMPLIFWATGDWVWFLLMTTLPVGLFALYSKYMIESPRWLAAKRHLSKCAIELNRIAKINGRNVVVTEKMLDEMLPDVKVEAVYGIASLFTGWRLAKNTILIVAVTAVTALTYFVLIMNSTRMGGNPFLNFLYQSLVEFPSFFFGRWIGDRIGRRLSTMFSFLGILVTTLFLLLFVRDPEYENLTVATVVFAKFCAVIIFFSVNLQSMEIYPTVLRQSGIAVGAISASALGVFGPYIIFLGTEYDVAYPYMIIGEFVVTTSYQPTKFSLCFSALLSSVGFCCALFLPETLYHKLPNTLEEAQKFGKDQRFWAFPKKPLIDDYQDAKELEPLEKAARS